MSASSQPISPATQTTQPPQATKNLPSNQEKAEAGASWKLAERHVLPYNRLWIVVSGLFACFSLAALDQVFIPFTFSYFRRINSDRPSLLQRCPLSSKNLVRGKITAGLAGKYVIFRSDLNPDLTPLPAHTFSPLAHSLRYMESCLTLLGESLFCSLPS